MSLAQPPSPVMTLGDVKRELRRLIEENAGLPGDVIRDDSTVDGDLAMDSMSLLSLQVAVEETFGITFAPEDLEACSRFEAIAALIFERVTAAAAPHGQPRPAVVQRSRVPDAAGSRGQGPRRPRAQGTHGTEEA